MSHRRKGLTALLVLGFVLLIFPPDAFSALYNLPDTQPVTVTASPGDSLSSNVGANTLEWNTDSSASGSSSHWWGHSYHDWDNNKHKHRRGRGHENHTTVAPIPNAAWLLGSGVVALFVLKRRKSTT